MAHDDIESPRLAEPIGPDEPTFVVGIGASAGGLEAIESFFSRLPEDSGLAFVVVQHLSPQFESVMDELLARRTPLPIHPADNGVRLKKNAVYLIPRGKELSVVNGHFLLVDRPPDRLTFPIDVFFRSLAEDYGGRAIAIVLSGTGTDGSRGIQDIRNNGGLVLVQDEASAKFSGMPVCAAASGQVDAVLAPEAMPQRLLDHATAEGPHATSQTHQRLLEDVSALLLSAHGLDLSQYKSVTVLRRIQKRIPKVEADNFEQYVEILKRDADELTHLHRDLLIGVTRFMRDREAFDQLQASFPSILANAGPDGVRVWVPGCATGQEAYTIAALFRDFAAKQRIHPDSIKIFATDVNRESLAVASTGAYPEDLLESEPNIITRHFEEREGLMHVRPELRRMIVFAPHNILKDPPFTRLDLVSCRNVLIYLTTAAQRRVMALFHFALRKNGLLFLGPSESLGELDAEFDTVAAQAKLFRKRRDIQLKDKLRISRGDPVPAARPSSPPEDFSAHAAFHRLLQRYVPATVVVNEQHQVVHVFGDATQYLLMRPGRTSLDIDAIVHENLRTPLIAAVQRVRRTASPITCPAIPIATSQGSERITLRVEPIRDHRLKTEMYLVSFEPDAKSSEAASGAIMERSAAEDLRMMDLQEELRATEERLETTIEELETSNEELQATNEELLSSNEEMQSTNEELQSVNEELYTVNAEHQRKIAELVELNHDLDNLLRGSVIETLFLDGDLRIRRYTPSVTESFSLLPADVGRPLRHLASNLVYDNLISDARQALASETPVEREVINRRGTWLSMRIRPYRTSFEADGDVEGVVITFTDITRYKAMEKGLDALSAVLRDLMQDDARLVFVHDADGHRILMNAAAQRATEASPALVGPWPPEDPQLLQVMVKQLQQAKTLRQSLRLRRGDEEHAVECELRPVLAGDQLKAVVCTANADPFGP